VDSPSARSTFSVIFKTLRDGNYRLVRFLDAFYELPSEIQDSLVAWLQEHVGNDNWKQWSDDRYSYPQFVEAVFLHYSGREELNQPTLEDLAKLIGEFCKSKEFKEISQILKADIEIESFKEELEAL